MTTYNKTQLNPDSTFERHVYHRDQFAHYLRWTHVLKRAKIGMKVLDFGCGNAANLVQVFYRNRFKLDNYLGLDIRKLSKKGQELIDKQPWMHFATADLVEDNIATEYGTDWDMITSFEVIEHIGKQNADKFLQNIQKCCNEKTVVLLSTPVYSEKQGPAKNHIIDGEIGEFGFDELKEYIEKHFVIKEVYGTFASVSDYKKHMNDEQRRIYEQLHKYYDSNMMSVIMAPLFPQYSRNAIWILNKRTD